MAITKLDMTASEGQGHVATIWMPQNCICGEPLFVARDPDGLKAGETAVDDGWLLTFVTEKGSGASWCNVHVT